MNSHGARRGARAAGYRPPENLDHPFRTEEDVLGEQPQSREAESDCGGIPAAVSLVIPPRPVVRATVALDDKPAVDEEIHSADAVDSNLQVHVASQTAQHEADEGLGTRLRTLVEKRPQGSVAPGKVREDVSETVFIHCPEMPRAVERGDRIPRPLAAHRCT